MSSETRQVPGVGDLLGGGLAPLPGPDRSGAETPAEVLRLLRTAGVAIHSIGRDSDELAFATAMLIDAAAHLWELRIRPTRVDATPKALHEALSCVRAAANVTRFAVAAAEDRGRRGRAEVHQPTRTVTTNG